MGKLRTFLSYPLGTQVRLIAGACLLLVLPVALRLVSFSCLRETLLSIATGAGHVHIDDPQAVHVARTVAVADRALPGSRKCLTRSLTTEFLLRVYGYSPTHRIGVDKEPDGTVKAHSWIEHEGRILIGDLEDLNRYEPLPPLDGGDES